MKALLFLYILTALYLTCQNYRMIFKRNVSTFIIKCSLGFYFIFNIGLLIAVCLMKV